MVRERLCVDVVDALALETLTHNFQIFIAGTDQGENAAKAVNSCAEQIGDQVRAWKTGLLSLCSLGGEFSSE